MSRPRPPAEAEDTFGCDRPGCTNWSPDPISDGWWARVLPHKKFTGCGKLAPKATLCNRHKP